METFDSLINQQKSLHQSLVIIRDTVAQLTSIPTIFLDEVKNLYTNFSNNQIQLNKLILDEASMQENQQSVNNLHTEFETLYYKLLAIIASSNETKPIISPNVSPVQTVSLPKVNLPTFDGSISEFENFISLYDALIHNNLQLSSTQKFQYFQMSLKGNALSIISNLPISEANYTIAYNAFVQRYSNKRRLAAYHYSVLSTYVRPSKPSFEVLQKFVAVHSNAVNALKQLQIDLTDFLLFSIAYDNLDPSTRSMFEDKLQYDQFPTYQQLIDFVTDRLRACELLELHSTSASGTRPKSPNKSQTDNRIKPRTLITETRSDPPEYNNRPINKCFHCNSNSHLISQCPNFRELSIEERILAIKNKQRCTACFGKHSQSNCKSTNSCRYCLSKSHHSLLHRFTRTSRPMSPQHSSDQELHAVSPSVNSSIQTNPGSSPNSSSLQYSTVNNLSCVSNFQNVLLGTAIVHVLDAYDNFVPMRAVIDSGSQATIISVKAAHRLNLRIRPTPTRLVGIAASTSTIKGVTPLKISSSVNPSLKINCSAFVVSHIVGNLPTVSLNRSALQRFQNLQLADPQFYKSGPVDLLLGADIYSELFSEQHSSIIHGTPSAMHTVFGWIIFGKTSLSPRNSNLTTLFCTNDVLHSSLQRFWEIEEISTTPTASPQDILCEELFKKTTTRDPSGKYVVALPFKPDSVTLKSNRERVLRNYSRFENQLKSNPDKFSGYQDFMSEYINLGHMSLTSNPSQYIIPHHCVYKESSSTTKIRTVFNASYPDSAGNSLNNQLMAGPKLQRDLSNILISFRFNNYVICADIKMMYRQILIRPEDRQHQHIFYRPHEDAPICEYELNTVTYGVTPSAFHAQRALIQLVQDHGSDFPLAADVVLHQSYVDDLISGTDTIGAAQELISQLISLLSCAGFELRKWTFNYAPLLNNFPLDHLENPLAFSDESSTVKILGLQWNPSSDTFSYNVSPSSAPVTKRQILSDIARIFDPLGFLTPVILWAKCFIKQLWISSLDWDQPLPEELVALWTSFSQQLSQLTSIRIPRFMGTVHAYCHVLGFCDASEKGYAAVIYIYFTVNGKSSTQLLKAKSRVSPSKTVTIPRLELCAALLLARLYESILDPCSKLNIVTTRLHTDAQIVLGWLRTPPHRLKIFVANRVTRILSITAPSMWFYIPGEHNPADIASRGCLPTTLVNHNIWWHGPSCYQLPVDLWPSVNEPEINQDLPELRRAEIHVFVTQPVSNFSEELFVRFSSYLRLLRVVAYVLRFVHKTRDKPSRPFLLSLSAPEINESELLCARLTQQFHFNDEIKRLSSNQVNSKTFRSVFPRLDDTGVLRVGGRLRNSSLPYDAKHPILLPKNCHLSKLICDHYHKISLHSGPRTTQSLIVRKFWIFSLRSLLRSRISLCVQCIRIHGKPSQPVMADLPASRVSSIFPFYAVGIDYAGPFDVKLNATRKSRISKGYLAIFVCMATKAVHLELVSDLSTDAFLAAFDRFISRRGLPSDVYSDNGTNFVGARNQLQKLYSQLNLDQCTVIDSLANRSIKWHFNPPAAPNFGGLWEAAVKSAKLLLRKLLKGRSLTFEEYSTVFSRIEAVLNSRPLLDCSNESVEDSPLLTPGHFLTGRPLLQAPEPVISSSVAPRSRWALLRSIHQSFWHTWSRDYLHTQTQRHRWNRCSKPLQVGQVVIVTGLTTPSTQWPLGRIIHFNDGKDHISRVATIKTSHGTLVRPVNKLIGLPFSSSS